MKKICSKCKQEKDLSEFNIDKTRKFGVTCACKKCRHPDKNFPKVGFKFCSKCGQEKEKSCFYKSEKMTIGLSSWCKDCEKIHRDSYNKEKVPNITGYKICGSCKIDKDVSEFYSNKGAKDLLNSNCKSCKASYYIHNSEKILNRSKKRYDENYESIKKRRRELEEADEKKQQVKVEKFLERARIHELVLIKRKIKNLIGSSFKRALNGQYIKSERTEEILGCNPLFFKEYIESQFLNWMNWDNHGNVCVPLEYNCSWDLDHIIPISQAKTEEDILKLNHWSNIQPLCSKINRYDKKEKVVQVTNLELKITINN
jgi:hypothetical protein